MKNLSYSILVAVTNILMGVFLLLTAFIIIEYRELYLMNATQRVFHAQDQLDVVSNYATWWLLAGMLFFGLMSLGVRPSFSFFFTFFKLFKKKKYSKVKTKTEEDRVYTETFQEEVEQTSEEPEKQEEEKPENPLPPAGSKVASVVN